MKKNNLRDLKLMKKKEKKIRKTSLVVKLSELILMQKTMKFLLKLVKYTITLLNQLKNL